MKSLDHYWYSWNPVSLLLLPVSLVFCLLVVVRRQLYRAGLIRSGKLPVPVIVVGNITVGGTGKTPLVIWLAKWFQGRGLKPGIITRGYGGRSDYWPIQVLPDTPAAAVGDEAVMISRHTDCPVYVGPDRLKAGHQLTTDHPCDIVISDDGLQHYALQRDMELVVIDGDRRFGNGVCLPAGPLREPTWRLRRVDLILTNGRAKSGEYSMRVEGHQAFSVNGSQAKRSLDSFSTKPVEVIAGIGNPERFFSMLETAGLQIYRHAFPDHHPFSESDLQPYVGKTVLMTEKDAVKCESFAGNDVWFVPAYATLDQKLNQQLVLLTERMLHG